LTGTARRLPAQLNAVAAAAAEVVGKFSTLAWTVVAARLLTQEEFGAFTLALSLALMISAIAEWGFDPMIIVRGSREPRLLSRLHSQTIAWQTLIGVPVFVVAGAAAWFSRPTDDAQLALVFVLCAVFLDLWSDTARSTSAAAQNQAGTATAVSVQRLSAAVLIVPALALGLGLVGMAVAFALSAVIGWVAHVMALRQLGIGFRLELVDRAGMRGFARGTFMLGVSSVLLMALFRIDALLLAALKDDAAVGEYAASYRLFETVLFLTYAVMGAVAPLMSTRLADRVETRRLTELSIAVLAAVYVPFGLVCLLEAPAVLELLYGERYVDGAGALRWLAAAPLVYGISAILGMVLVTAEKTRGVLVGAAAAVLLNVGLNLALIPSLAGTGAGLATTASYTAEAAIGLVFVAALAGRVRIAASHAEPVLAAVPAGVLLVALDVALVIEAPLAMLVYGVAWGLLVRARRPDVLEAVRGLAPGRNAGATP
jgi:O-antigen/teichoic acid export membrane protein